MFIAALFTTAKTWKQPKCPSIDGLIKKMWDIHAMEYYSAMKKNYIMPSAATQMDLEIIILREIRKRKIQTSLVIQPLRLCLSTQGVLVQTLVRELRFNMPQSQKTKT